MFTVRWGITGEAGKNQRILPGTLDKDDDFSALTLNRTPTT